MKKLARTRTASNRLVTSYMNAKEFVLHRGYASEVDWQDNLSLNGVDESAFLRESAWVILSAGMRETVIRRVFAAMSPVFRNWSSARVIIDRKDACRREALSIFRHPGKVDAMIQVADRVVEYGFESIRQRILCDGVDYLRSFPFIGPVTAYHLAKNLGLNVVKPDRHLVRMAHATGYESPEGLCREIASHVADKLAVIDLVLWRYATLDPKYLRLFTMLPFQAL